MCVQLWREHAQDIVVFMDRFSKVPSLLLVPPVGVGVAELAGDGWGVDVAAILGGETSVRLVESVREWVFVGEYCVRIEE